MCYFSNLKIREVPGSKSNFFRKSKFSNKTYTYGKGKLSNEFENPSEIGTTISDDREMLKHLTNLQQS